MVERGGRVRVRVIPRVVAPAKSKVLANVNPNAILFTDDWMAYRPLKRNYLDHRVINHSAGLYVQGDVSYEHHRRVLREPQNRNARGIQEGVTPTISSRI